MKSRDLENRFRNFAIRTAKLVNGLAHTQSNLVYGKQIIRSSSSIEANYSEAIYAHSRLDFLHCLNTSRKEANETLHWLTLLKETNYGNKEINDLIKEIDEILRILVSSVKTTKENSALSDKIVSTKS